MLGVQNQPILDANKEAQSSPQFINRNQQCEQCRSRRSTEQILSTAKNAMIYAFYKFTASQVIRPIGLLVLAGQELVHIVRVEMAEFVVA